ncbi:3D domain-containing protein [Sporomusa acidovorans]|uniref:3D domain-containing protein n=1 Tax=Sporomusa acidovorans (strain ATCC 49682 / DSM 3132 / Mol) TaxID=1123286 RepID=A0ABZ3J423_SPOA4|nr:3D domain-containing protein [Sporomusa acidovorans]OZC20944.1 cell wall-binding protein YocH precursor [Sporomusa acidovorans DSM 3132]SDE61906.1 3D (Asp-Asp-Asp) domain-containing protein [Sporomusa acidovorans]
MRRKLAAILLMVFAMPLLGAALPRAEAASFEGKLAEVTAGNSTAAQIQELIKMRNTLSQNDKQAIWGELAQKTIEQSERGAIVKNLTTLTQQLLTQGQASTNADITKAVESAVRGKVQETLQEEINSRLAEYQEKVALLSTLLNNRSSLTPQAVEDNNALAGAPQNYRKILDMTATAYAPGYRDNGSWNNLTYVGGKVKKGVVAVDPAIIPMGTKLWIEGYGEALAEDQGSAIKGNRIDLAFNTRQEALNYGIQNIKVYVLP